MHARGHSPFTSPKPGDLVRTRSGAPDRLVVAFDKEAGIVTYENRGDGCPPNSTRTVVLTSWSQWCSRVRARLVMRGALPIPYAYAPPSEVDGC
jgi:hypothetical protein